MNLLSSKIFNLLFITISCIILLPSCSSDDDDVSQNQKFRERFSGTVWEYGNDLFIKFSEDKLYYFKYGDSFNFPGCYYREEGSTANVVFDGCIYDKVTYVIINEDSDNLTFRVVVPSGTPKPPRVSGCDGGSALEIFQVESENTITFTDNGEEPITLLKSDEIFASNSCSNALSSGILLL